MNESKIFVAIAIILILGFLQNAVNSKKSQRVRQLPMVIIASLLMVIGVLAWVKNSSDATKVCEISEYLIDAELLVVNCSLLAGFAVIKLLLIPATAFLFKSEKFAEAFSLGLYQHDDEYNEWFLKKKWVNYRTYVFTLVVVLHVATGVYLGLTWFSGKTSNLWLSVFPCAVLVVANEIYSCINGQTKEEFVHSVLGDDADARRVSNYYRLREVLEQLLPEPLLSAYTGCDYAGSESSAELLKQMQERGDELDLITAEFFNADGRYKTADVDCVQATLNMMHRRNMVFFNPFYRDLGMYITLPIVKALLSGKKCVVLCGRSSAEEDVKCWLTELLCEYSHMRSLWRVNYLSDKEPECEVGIITFTQIYDKRVINTNMSFLNETDFVFMVEPSVMLNTSQVALSIIAAEMHKNDEKPVYCICDRNTDGLVDTLSHLLHAELTDVVAMPVPRCDYTAMLWNADGDFCRQKLFDKQTKYLGDGIELASIAIKNQIPQVSWYSEAKAPIRDIKWIAGQYYSSICRYMNQPCQQESLYAKIRFSPNLWSARASKEEFVIVEDEFCNMFSMMRAFLSRGRAQAFVNVLSESYLLRDYMRCNRQMFMANPNAIPSLVPDYAKTERNTILKLILTSAIRPVSDSEVLRELHLVGIESDDAFFTMTKLMKRYTFADSSIFTVQSIRNAIDEFTTISSCVYSIDDEEFNKYFSDSLKNAYYILEDEKCEEEYIDAKLFSHVTQTILPGQFVTYDGKYYVAKHISPQSGVVLRRASDLFDGRKYYRQIRKYFFDSEQGESVSSRKIGDVEFSEIRTDFHVDTTGYLEMGESHNLRTARLFDYSDDPTVSNYSRKYRNKSVVRIKLPDSDERIRFTLCLLLSEVFKSAFPDGWQYIAVVTKRPDDIDGMLNYMVYPIEGNIDEQCIYVIEDSDIDLGLLDAVEKNFMKFMEIIADFLDWHCEKMRESASKDPVPARVSAVEMEDRKKRNLIVRMLDRIRKLFGAGSEPKVTVEDVENIENVENAGAVRKDIAKDGEIHATPEEAPKAEGDSEYELEPEADKKESGTPDVAPASSKDSGEYTLEDDDSPQAKNSPENAAPSLRTQEPGKEAQSQEDKFQPADNNDPDLVAIDGTDIFDNTGMPEDNDYLEHSFMEMGLIPITKSRYQRECFLKFGYDEIDSRIGIDEVRKYLRVRGWSNNSLTLARKREVLKKTQIDLKAVNQCDFCGLPLSGVSYERLNDGRVRCNDCSSSAISSVNEFKELFYRTLGILEDVYGIRYRIPVKAMMADARTIAKGAGRVFKPSTEMAARILGFAQRKNGRYNLIVENGSPRLATIETIVHEMTHIWQYMNWNDSQIEAIYKMNSSDCSGIARDIVYEGMAMWSSIQYLYQIGESYYAAQQELLADARMDVYGVGFRLYKEQFPLSKDSSVLKYSPFASFPTLEPEAVKNAIIAQCREKGCTCK